MSESIPIFEHTTASGSVTAALIPARGAFIRATNVPSNWKTVRVALILSLRGANATSAPATEGIAYSTNQLQQWQVGLSNGGGMPGTAGVRMVGVGAPSTYGAYCAYNASSGWVPFGISITDGYARPGGRIYDGTTVVSQASVGNVTLGAPTPLGTTGFCFGIMFEFGVATAGSLQMKFACATNLSCATPDAVGAALEALMVATVAGTWTITGGWWSSSVDVGCTTLFVRLPFASNRLVIHGYKVAQTG